MLWVLVWMVGAIGGQSATAPLGGLGVGRVGSSMLAAMTAEGIDAMQAINRTAVGPWEEFDLITH